MRREAASLPGRVRADIRREFPVRFPSHRIRTVQDALAAGLTVTTVRTYRLPDGRQVEVVTQREPHGGPEVILPPY